MSRAGKKRRSSGYGLSVSGQQITEMVSSIGECWQRFVIKGSKLGVIAKKAVDQPKKTKEVRTSLHCRR